MLFQPDVLHNDYMCSLKEEGEMMNAITLRFHEPQLNSEFEHLENEITRRRAQWYMYLLIPLLLARIGMDITLGYGGRKELIAAFLFSSLCLWLAHSRFYNRLHFVFVFQLATYAAISHMFSDPTFPGDFMFSTILEVVSYTMFLQRWIPAMLLRIAAATVQSAWMWEFIAHQHMIRFVVQVVVMVAFCGVAVYVIEREARRNFLVYRNQQKSEAKWKKMMDACRDGVLVQQKGGGIVYTNEAAKTLFGSQLTARDQVTISDLLTSSNSTHDIHKMTSDIFSPSTSTSSIVNQPFFTVVDGVHTHIELSASATELNNQPAVLAMAHNVTERKRTEESNSRFLASCSHELRTPLNAVIGALQVIHSLPGIKSNLESTKLLDIAISSGHHLLTLVDSLLDLSKIQEGKFDLERIRYRPVDEFQSAVQALKYQSTAKSISFDTRIGMDIPPVVMGDPQRFRQILFNVLSNAFKFTLKHGSVTASLSVVERPLQPPPNPIPDLHTCILNYFQNPESSPESTQKFLQIEVEDTGIGIKEGDLKRLFTVFGKLEDPRRLNSGGTGLGLAICKQLCELMRGEIGVYSTYGKGTRMWFAIPLQTPTENETSPTRSDSEGESPQMLFPAPRLDRFPEVRKRRMTSTNEKEFMNIDEPLNILIVEDNAFNMEIVRAMLKSEGHRMEFADNGLVALETYKRKKGDFDVILMDCQMPVMDGYEATQSIRQFEKEQGLEPTRIIGLTAFAMRWDKERCLKAGMDDYVSKPVSRKLLCLKVKGLASESDVNSTP